MVTFHLRPSKFSRKEERSIPTVGALLLEIAGSTHFSESHSVHGDFQIPLDLDSAHSPTFRGEDTRSLCEAL